jgi:ABC-type glycerol-3-phosphate transport system substrate-binding protein
MKKILTFAMVASGALALAACGGKTEEAPAEEPAAEAEMMAPAETPAAEEPAAADTPAATEEVDPTSNPIPPA